jgi:HPt (histidine-containing phosphotransfer) domain-containing protein
LLDRLSGDQELAIVIVSSFRKEMQGQLTAFGQAVTSPNVSEAQSLAHSIKGASGSVGCPRLQGIAQYAEHACREGRMDDARTAGAEFFAAFAKAESAFREAGLFREEGTL